MSIIEISCTARDSSLDQSVQVRYMSAEQWKLVRSAVVNRQFSCTSTLGCWALNNWSTTEGICLMQLKFLGLIGSRYSNICVEITS